MISAIPKDLHSRWTICPIDPHCFCTMIVRSMVSYWYCNPDVLRDSAIRVDPNHQSPFIFPCFNFPRLLCLVDSTSTDLSRVADGPTWRAKARARLLSLDLHDFKSIRRRNFQLEGRSLSCLVGSNSSGKSAILDALRFALCRHCDRNLRDYIRRGKPITSAARVTAQFRYEQEADEGSIQGKRSLNLQMY